MSTEDVIDLAMSEVFSIRNVYICIYTLARKVSEVHVILAASRCSSSSFIHHRHQVKSDLTQAALASVLLSLPCRFQHSLNASICM